MLLICNVSNAGCPPLPPPSHQPYARALCTSDSQPLNRPGSACPRLMWVSPVEVVEGRTAVERHPGLLPCPDDHWSTTVHAWSLSIKEEHPGSVLRQSPLERIHMRPGHALERPKCNHLQSRHISQRCACQCPSTPTPPRQASFCNAWHKARWQAKQRTIDTV